MVWKCSWHETKSLDFSPLGLHGAAFKALDVTVCMTSFCDGEALECFFQKVKWNRIVLLEGGGDKIDRDRCLGFAFG